MIRKEVFGYTVFEDGKVIGKAGQIMSPSNNGRGYLILGLMLDGKRRTKAVHKLVALGFVPNPDNLPEVNHKDGNKLNNHYTNLEWVSRGRNIEHAFQSNLRSALGESNARCKTNETTVRRICEFLQQGYSSAEIRDIGFTYGLVRAIKSKKNWTHISASYSF